LDKETNSKQIRVKIADVEIRGAAALAPMAGCSDLPFRELCREFSASYTVTEMVSAKGFILGDRKSDELMTLGKNEHPAAIQLFGSEPQIMARAAEKALRFSPDIIDINMGCPATKIIKGMAGSSLMRDTALAGRIVKEVASAVSLPVTVKIRAGWNKDSINAVEMAKVCEQNGAAAICVHGRTKDQMYAPPVNLDVIKAVKESVSVPVIGNGDIETPEDAKRMLEYTGCDLVMVGRGALGRPWIFKIINEYLESGVLIDEPPVKERMGIMLEHIERLCRYKGEYIGMLEARKHAAWYTKSLKGASLYRRELSMVKTFDELKKISERIIEEQT